MKRKLLGTIIVLTLALGYCKPPMGECVGVNQKPAQCRGTYPPRPSIVVRPIR